MKKLKGKYIGYFKIKKATIHDSKTAFGKERVLVEYEELEDKELEGKLGKRSADIFPKKILVHIVTDKISDLTKLQIARTKPVVTDIMAVLMESELSMDDMKYVINTDLMETIKEVYNQADSMLWGKPYFSLTLLDIDKVLKKK